MRTVRVAPNKNEFYDVTLGGLGKDETVLSVEYTRLHLSGAVESACVYRITQTKPITDDVLNVIVRARSL